MTSFTPTGRHKLEFTVGDMQEIVVKCEVDFDTEEVIDWSAEDWHGNEALHDWNSEDMLCEAWEHLERKWRAEQKLVKLILADDYEEVI